MENKDTGKFLNKKLEETVNKKNQETAKRNKKKKKKNKKNKQKMAIIAIVLAVFTAVTSFIVAKLSKKDDKNDVYEKPENSIVDMNTSLSDEEIEEVSTLITEERVTLDSLGLELEESTLKEEKKKEYGETTGNVNKDEIITDEDSTNWVDEEAASKADEVGNTEIDNQEDTLEVESDGDVVEKDEYYEIIKEDGSITSGIIETDESENNNTNESNDSEIPDGYEYDENLDKVVAEEDANKYVYVDADYYDMNGELIFSKGDVVLKETFDRIKKDSNLTTNKLAEEEESKVEEEASTPEVSTPEVSTPEVSTPEVSTPEASTPEVSTPEVSTPEASTPEVSTPEVSTPEVSIPEVSTPEVSEPSIKDESSSELAVVSCSGVVNEDGTYTVTFDFQGEIIAVVTYIDEATYKSWLLDENQDENYADYNGIIYPVSVIEEMNLQKQKIK